MFMFYIYNNDMLQCTDNTLGNEKLVTAEGQKRVVFVGPTAPPPGGEEQRAPNPSSQCGSTDTANQ